MEVWDVLRSGDTRGLTRAAGIFVVGGVCDFAGMALILRGTELRYALTRLLQLIGPCSIPQLCAGLEDWGFAVEGRPSKTVSDALRWERRRGRVYRRGRGLYSVGWAPRSTEYRIMSRVSELLDEVARQSATQSALGDLSLRGGQLRSEDFQGLM